MNLRLDSYATQSVRWPDAGRHILAQYDSQEIVVYQAYSPAIGSFAVTHQRFGGPFSYRRMSWIKPNFLWMMYRSGWGTKPGQEVVLAIHLRRLAFDQILSRAVVSTYVPVLYPSEAVWRQAVASSEVRLQWDPDHDPHGQPCARRAIQLGLRGQTLHDYGGAWILGIEDVTPLVEAGRRQLAAGDLAGLATPAESVYAPGDPAVARAIGLTQTPNDSGGAP